MELTVMFYQLGAVCEEKNRPAPQIRLTQINKNILVVCFRDEVMASSVVSVCGNVRLIKDIQIT